jgi:hypothetical protein
MLRFSALSLFCLRPHLIPLCCFALWTSLTLATPGAPFFRQRRERRSGAHVRRVRCRAQHCRLVVLCAFVRIPVGGVSVSDSEWRCVEPRTQPRVVICSGRYRVVVLLVPLCPRRTVCVRSIGRCRCRERYESAPRVWCHRQCDRQCDCRRRRGVGGERSARASPQLGGGTAASATRECKRKYQRECRFSCEWQCCWQC